MNLLHIDSSILSEGSASRSVTAAIVARLREAHPGLTVTHTDLAAAPLPHLTLASLPPAHPAAAAGSQDEAAAAQAALDAFMAADIVVIGAPMYNFSVPSQLKAWIDRILVPGTTFKYGANGVEGLAAGKRVIISIIRGGLYGAESPAAAAEHAESYLRAVFGFIGVTPEFIVAEGVSMGPDKRHGAL
ncbi:MAG TPA: NAD(P)H-dependent oxidoreductase, partial [Acetobacteraceae bacterium]